MTKALKKLHAELSTLKEVNSKAKKRLETEEAKAVKDGPVIMLLDTGIHQRNQLINRIEKKIAKNESKGE